MAATEDAMTALKIANQKDYIDFYPLTDNPLPFVIPFADKNFFGPCVCNIIGISKACDSVDMQDQIDFFKTVYDRFLLYETHIWVDSDAFTGDSATTESIMEALCDELADYGFTYHGKINGSSIGTLVTDIHREFKEKVNDKFAG